MAILTDRQIAGLARSAGFPSDQLTNAVAIALAESGGRTDALNTANRNGSWDAGLWQINSIHGYSQQQLFDPKTNAAAAFRVWSDAGKRWTPWSVYNSGRYITFRARAAIAAQNPIGFDGPNVPNGNGTDPPLGILPANPLNPFQIFSDQKLWLRVGLVLLGGFMMLFGLVKLAGVGRIITRVVK